MAYQFLSIGANSAVFNAATSPVLPPTYSAGNLLLLGTASYQGKLSTPTIAGWTLLSPSANAPQTAIYGRIATKNSADQPSVNWGDQWETARIAAYSGNPSTLTGIVNASIDKVAATTGAITYPALTPTQDGCLLLYYGSRDKTSTTNGATFAAPSGTNLRTQSNTAGTALHDVFSDLIQTSATAQPQITQTPSILETAVQQYQSIVLALIPAGSAPPPPPPPPPTTGGHRGLPLVGTG